MSKPDAFGETTIAQIKAVKKYDAEHTTSIHLKLNMRTDQDVIKWLWKQKSKQGSIKSLIRKAIAEENN